MIKSRYFRELEFKALTPSCSLQDMEQRLMSMLDNAREHANIPFVLTCAYRSVEWDKAKGRSGNSAHTRGKAVDILCKSSSNRYKVIEALLYAGFKRIGVGKNFIHADCDDSLPNPVIFHYYE